MIRVLVSSYTVYIKEITYTICTNSEDSFQAPRLLKKSLCSTQLSMKFFLLINIKIKIVGILTFMSRKNSLIGLSEPEKKLNFLIFYSYEHLEFHAQLSGTGNKFYNLGPS